MSYMENTAEQKICKIIKDAFKLGFDSETNDAIDYFDGIDESEEIISQLRANTSHFAEQVHSIAAALGMPIAPGHSVIHRVKELIAENNQLRENLWQHAERLEEVEMVDDYTKTVGAFNALTGRDLTPEEGVVFMICVKLSREVHAPRRDNRVDGAGYFNCLDKINQRRALEKIA